MSDLHDGSPDERGGWQAQAIERADAEIISASGHRPARPDQRLRSLLAATRVAESQADHGLPRQGGTRTPAPWSRAHRSFQLEMRKTELPESMGRGERSE